MIAWIHYGADVAVVLATRYLFVCIAANVFLVHHETNR
jgi:hypothetical protein